MREMALYLAFCAMATIVSRNLTAMSGHRCPEIVPKMIGRLFGHPGKPDKAPAPAPGEARLNRQEFITHAREIAVHGDNRVF